MADKDKKPDEEKKPDEIVIPDLEKEKPPEGYTEEEWSDLSDEEKEGILSKDEDEEPEKKEDELSEEQLKAIAKEGEEEEPKKPDEEGAPKEKEGEEKEEEEEAKRPSDEELLSFRPRIDRTQLPQPSEEIVPDELQGKLDDLQKKFDDGEIQMAAFIVERDKINRQIVRHNSNLYESAKEATTIELTWKSEQQAFFKARPEYEFAKEGSPKGKALYGALNQVVKDLDADPENAGLSGMAILVKADKIVKKAFGITEKEKPKETPKDKPKEKDKKPPAKLPDENKSLSDVPEAQRNSTDGPWAALDKLSGEAYERALEKLTPEQRNRYESSKV